MKTFQTFQTTNNLMLPQQNEEKAIVPNSSQYFTKTTQFSFMPKQAIFVANLGKYNEGIMQGEWLELPCTIEELETCYVNIGIGTFDSEGEYIHGKIETVNGYDYHYEEPCILDTDGEIVHEFFNGMYGNIENLNEEIELIDDLFFKNKIPSIEVLLYLIQYHRDNYFYILRDCSYTLFNDKYEVAEHYAYELLFSRIECDSVREKVKMHFDFDSYFLTLNCNSCDFTEMPDGTILELY